MSRKKLVAEKMKTYRVLIERDESGAWLASVPSVPGCHTYGRTLDAARRRIREALSLWVDDAGRAHLDFAVQLPQTARKAVRPFEAARQRAEMAQQQAQKALGSAAKVLVRTGFSLRDAGEILGLSHQRIAQVVSMQRSVPRKVIAKTAGKRTHRTAAISNTKKR